MAIHIIINPKSGSGLRCDVLADFRQALRSHGKETVEYVTRCAGDATAYASSIRGQAEAVVAWGGDGTVREISAALIGTPVPVLACPFGTENLLAKELQIPGEPNRMARIVADGLTKDCDLATANGQSFMLIMGVGFDGEVVRRLASVRRGHITHLSYFWPIWRTFWEHDFPRIRILSAGREIYNDFGMAFIGNISRYAVGLRICRDARFDDGLLDVVVFTCQEQTALVLHAAWTLLRVHPLKGNVLYRQLPDLRVECDGTVPSQIDGDVGPNTPLDIAVQNGKLKLLVPAHRESGFWPWRGE